jgi:ABC-type uncharacterized transport system fused permease/ATPase subunit
MLISHGNALAAPIAGWELCAPKYLTGTMMLGEVAQAVSAFVMVQVALNWLVDNYPGLAAHPHMPWPRAGAAAKHESPKVRPAAGGP